MKVFIDFDDVIFNTKKFKEDLKNMFPLHGVSSEIFDKYYVDPNDSRAIKTFNPWLHIERICNNESEIDKEKLNKFVQIFIADISSYIFNDVYDFIETVDKKNIVVVSFGEQKFQAKKVFNSNIGKKIKNIVITQSSKKEVIEKILQKEKNMNQEKTFFLDDRVEQIKDVKEKFPQIITILIKRPEGRYQEMRKDEYCDYETHDLMGAQDIILKRSNK